MQVVSNDELAGVPATAAKPEGIADLLSMDLGEELAAVSGNGGLSAGSSTAANALQDLLSGDLGSAVSTAAAGQATSRRRDAVVLRLLCKAPHFRGMHVPGTSVLPRGPACDLCDAALIASHYTCKPSLQVVQGHSLVGLRVPQPAQDGDLAVLQEVAWRTC